MTSSRERPGAAVVMIAVGTVMRGFSSRGVKAIAKRPNSVAAITNTTVIFGFRNARTTRAILCGALFDVHDAV